MTASTIAATAAGQRLASGRPAATGAFFAWVSMTANRMRTAIAPM